MRRFGHLSNGKKATVHPVRFLNAIRKWFCKPATPGASRKTIPEVSSRTIYLRTAQAYMLVSMPTDASTIFGHFQTIRERILCRGISI